MTRSLIYGEHNVGKTRLLELIIKNYEMFILIDSTCDEGVKSIINKSPELFDEVLTISEFIKKNYLKKRVGVNVSEHLEKYLITNDNNELIKFNDGVRELVDKIVNNELIDYLIVLDEVPLTKSELIKLKNYELIIVSDEQYYEENKELFDYLIHLKSNKRK